MKSMSVYALAKRAGVNPQSLYTLAKLGYLKAEKSECGECGHVAWRVSEEEASRYLAKRAARAAK
jgi:predicted site-specific integrase-resolvase